MNKLSDYDFDLPRELIAPQPLTERSASRLLLLDRATGEIRHQQLGDLPALFVPEDVLVINTDRVLPARIPGKTDDGADVEVMVIEESRDGSWVATLLPELEAGRRVEFGPDSAVDIISADDTMFVSVRFTGVLAAAAAIDKYGRMLLPPSMPRDSRPTDFPISVDMLTHLFFRTVRIAPIFLHVGPQTFAPVTTDDLSAYRMHAEAYHIDGRCADRINKGKRAGRTVWCVGATAVRALESAVEKDGTVRGGVGESALFIRPPFTFRVADRLITPLYLPRSTLLMTACAFGGYEPVMAAYREAVEQDYRFFDQGDAMAIL